MIVYGRPQERHEAWACQVVRTCLALPVGVCRKRLKLEEEKSLLLTSMPHLYSSSAISSAVQTRSSCLWCPPQASVSEASAARTSGAHPLLISAVDAVVSMWRCVPRLV